MSWHNHLKVRCSLIRTLAMRACVCVCVCAGVKEEGAVGLLKGTGRGLVGFLVRPAGGLIDLTSGTLEFVTRYGKNVFPLLHA